jgi:hypothetical protein
LKWRSALVLGATTLFLAPVGFLSIFSGFSPYDDEGYFLVSLRDYIGGHAAYTQIYGPFYYEVMGGAFRFSGLDVSTDNGRIVTLLVWLLASLVGGITVLTLTRNLWLGAAGMFLTFHALSALTDEPMHPAGLVGLLLVSLAAIASNRSRTPRASAVLIGSVVGALTLVKINVGAFAAMAVAFAFAAAVLSGRPRQVMLPVVGFVLVASPFLLTAALFDVEWVRDLAIVIALSVAAVGIACFVAAPPRLPRMDPVLAIVGGAALVFVFLGIAAAGGMRFSDFVGSLTTALTLPRLFALPAVVGVPNVAWAAVSVAACAWILTGRFGARASPAVPALARVAVGAFTWLAVLVSPSLYLLFAVPLAWVAVVPPAGDRQNPTDRFARLLLASLAVMETLQAYPVAGTQLWIAAMTFVPVGAICFNDGLRQLQVFAATRPSSWSSTVARSLAPGATIVNVAVWPLFAYLAASAYVSGQPLGLPGTELMRVPPAEASSLQSLVRAVNRDCASFITIPGMSSLYLWTGHSRFSQLDAGPWMFSLDASQQQLVVSQIAHRPGVCVVISQPLVDFWAEGRPIPRRPLVDYIDATFHPSAAFGIYELLIRNP